MSRVSQKIPMKLPKTKQDLKRTPTELMVIRAHALSLEPETLLHPYFKARLSGKLVDADRLSKTRKLLQPIQTAPKQRTSETDGSEIIQVAE